MTSQVGSVPFIQTIDGQMQVCKEGAQLLSSIKGKLAIVVVAGPYRTGKSFLLNRLSGHNSGFKVGGSIQACTKGIWVWGQPQKVGDLTVVLMDTEGLGSLDQSQTFDTQLFALALLLSSFFVLNTSGAINEATLEQLELVVECSKKIKYSDGVEEISDQYPPFLWILRDFTLELVDENNNPIDSRQYLENALQNQSKGRHYQEKNRIREAIKSVFHKRDCEILVRPVLEEKKLQNLEQIPWNDIRPEFREKIELVKRKIFGNSPPKTVSGNFLNGPSFVRLAETYVKSVNQGALPTIQSAWQNVITIQANDAMNQAESLYEREMSKTTEIVEDEYLQNLHQNAEKEAIQIIMNVSVGSEQFKQNLVDKFKEKTLKSFIERKKVNNTKSRLSCKELIEKIWDSMKVENREITTPESMNKIFDNLKMEYKKNARGPAKAEIESQFIELKTEKILSNVFEKLEESNKLVNSLKEEMSKLNKQIEQATSKYHEMDKSIHVLQVERDGLKKQLDDEKKLNSSLQEEKTKLLAVQQKYHQLNTDHEDLFKKYENLRNEIEKKEKIISEKTSSSDNLTNQVYQLNLKVDNLTQQLKSSQDKIEEQKRILSESETSKSNFRKTASELEDQNVLLRQKIESLQATIENKDSLLQGKIQDYKILQQTYESKVMEMNHQKGELVQEIKKELNSYVEKNAELQASIIKLEGEKKNIQDEASRIINELNATKQMLTQEVQKGQAQLEQLKKAADEHIHHQQQQIQSEYQNMNKRVAELESSLMNVDREKRIALDDANRVSNEATAIKRALEMEQQRNIKLEQQLTQVQKQKQDEELKRRDLEIKYDEIQRELQMNQDKMEVEKEKEKEKEKEPVTPKRKSRKSIRTESDEEYDMVSKSTPVQDEKKQPTQSTVQPSQPSQPYKDPTKCTVIELKSWLTRENIELPPTNQKKDVYLELLYKKFPDLRPKK